MVDCDLAAEAGPAACYIHALRLTKENIHVEPAYCLLECFTFFTEGLHFGLVTFPGLLDKLRGPDAGRKDEVKLNKVT